MIKFMVKLSVKLVLSKKIYKFRIILNLQFNYSLLREHENEKKNPMKININ